MISLGTTKDAIKAFVSVEMEEQSRSPNEETPCSKTYFYRVKETSTHRGTVSSDRINPKEVSTDSVCLSSAPRLFIQRWNLILGTTELRNSCKPILAAKPRVERKKAWKKKHKWKSLSTRIHLWSDACPTRPTDTLIDGTRKPSV